ncbi:MAG: CvpA family protein [SAR202 cluster bacterium]|nr:CvpA family protein [SAR202 cluster bacterium]
MNWVDIVIIVVIAISAFFGWRNGVIRWAVTLVGLLLGVIAASRLYTAAADLMTFIESESIQKAAGFAAVFLLVFVGAWLVGRAVKTVLNVLMLGWVDHAAGLAVGVLTGALAATALVTAFGLVPLSSMEKAVQASTLAGPLAERTGFITALMPKEFQRVKDLLQQGKDLIDDKVGGLTSG